MTRDEFQRQLSRLVGVYGDKSYPQERAVLIWKAVSNLSPEWFERTVDDLISSSRQAPLLSEFAPFIWVERERVHKIEKDKDIVRGSTNYFCDHCHDNGVYLCTLKGDRGAPYAFRCHCSKGQSDPRRSIPQYKQFHADLGFKYYEIGWIKDLSI